MVKNHKFFPRAVWCRLVLPPKYFAVIHSTIINDKDNFPVKHSSRHQNLSKYFHKILQCLKFNFFYMNRMWMIICLFIYFPIFLGKSNEPKQAFKIILDLIIFVFANIFVEYQPFGSFYIYIF